MFFKNSLSSRFIFLAISANALAASLAYIMIGSILEHTQKNWEQDISSQVSKDIDSSILECSRGDYVKLSKTILAVRGVRAAALYNNHGIQVYTTSWGEFPQRENLLPQDTAIVKQLNAHCRLSSILLKLDPSKNPVSDSIKSTLNIVFCIIIASQIAMVLAWRKYFYKPLTISLEGFTTDTTSKNDFSEIQSIRTKIISKAEALISIDKEKTNAARNADLFLEAKKTVHDILASLQRLKDAHLTPEHKDTLVRSIENHVLSILPEKKKKPSTQHIDVKSLLNEFEPFQKAIQVKISLEGSSKLPSRFDAEALSRIMLILITNAIDAGSSMIFISLTSDSQQFQLEAASDGEKIPDKIVTSFNKRIYETSKEEGSGLGLRHVDKLVSSAGGETRILNRDDKATVILSIPQNIRETIFIPSNTELLIVMDNSEVAFEFTQRVINSGCQACIFDDYSSLIAYATKSNKNHSILVTDGKLKEQELSHLKNSDFFPKFFLYPLLANHEIEGIVSLETISPQTVITRITDIVVIDDDKYYLSKWTELANCRVHLFQTIPILDDFNPIQTIVLLDRWLGDLNTETWENNLRNKGFKNIFSISSLPSDASIPSYYLGKKYPWS